METPVLSKNQQRKSLSAKKSKRETIKTLITTPFLNYWPLLKEDDLVVVKGVLNEHLQLIRPGRPKVPWKEIKTVAKENRKDFRAEYLGDKLKPSLSKDGTIFGINEITKQLENNSVHSILIASDVKPRLMVSHVIDMAVYKKVPVLIVPELREILKFKTGINSVIIGFKKGLKQDSQYFHIQEKIQDIYRNYPVPEKQINYHRQRTLDSSNVEITAKELDLNLSLSSEEDKLKDNDEVKMEEDRADNLYLYRISKKVRAFVPSEGNDLQTKMENTSDFISLESGSSLKCQDTVSICKEQKVDFIYNSLRVKKVKANKDRFKRKVEIIKKKK